MVSVYLDGADLDAMLKWIGKIDGITTNPSLCRKAGITDYRAFARDVLTVAVGKPVSFEVFSDDFKDMERQAREIASWGSNVLVKIPVTNTKAEPSYELVSRLVRNGVKVNLTAVFTKDQARLAIDSLNGSESIVSIFAGRIADTGHDPSRIIRSANSRLRGKTRILWASAREVYNVKQAEECGAEIITLSPELVAKLDGFGRDLNEYSLATVRQFNEDAKGLTL